LKVAVVNLKGGTGKTTTSIYMAAALTRLGGRTLLVDSDPQGSSLSWSEAVSEPEDGLPFSVVGLPVKDLHRQVADHFPDYEHLIVDTPPGEQAIVRSALMAVDAVVLPISPGLLDVDRLRPTLELLSEMEAVNPVAVYVLLTRVRRGTKSARAAREVLGELGFHLFEAEIPLLESYAGSFGLAPVDLGEYASATDELVAVREHVL
jgi:chromosome partitioning protein